MRVAVRNAADPEQTRKAGRKEKDRAELEKEDMRAVLATPAGRRLLYRILNHTGMYRSSFTGNSETFFKEGERNVGLWLTQQIEDVDRRALLQMLAEQIETEGE